MNATCGLIFCPRGGKPSAAAEVAVGIQEKGTSLL